MALVSERKLRCYRGHLRSGVLPERFVAAKKSLDAVNDNAQDDQSPKQDIYARVTAKMVAVLEDGVRPWVRLLNAEYASLFVDADGRRRRVRRTTIAERRRVVRLSV